MPSPFAQPGSQQGAPTGAPAAHKTSLQYSDPRILSGDPLAHETEEQSRNALLAAMNAAEQGASPEQIAQLSGTYAPSDPGPGQFYAQAPAAPAPSSSQDPAGSPSSDAPGPLGAPLFSGPIPGVPAPGQPGYTPGQGESASKIKVGEKEYTPEQIQQMADFNARREEIQSGLYARLNEMKTMATNVENAQRQAEEATYQAQLQMQQSQQMQAWAAQNPEQFAEWAATQTQAPMGGPAYAGMTPQPFSQAKPQIHENFDPNTFKSELLGEVKNLLSTEGKTRVRASAENFVSDLVRKEPIFNGREKEVQLWIADELRREAAAGAITPQTEGWELHQKINSLVQKKSLQDKTLFDAYTAHQRAAHQQASAGLTPPVGNVAATAVPQRPASQEDEENFYRNASDADFNRLVTSQWEEFDRAVAGLAAG